MFLAKLLKLDRPGKGNERLQQELISLSGGDKTALKKYYAKKLAVFFVILFSGALLSGIGFLFSANRDQDETVTTLERPGYGQGDRKESLSVQIDGDVKTRSMEVTVQERKYTDAEKQELIDRAIAELELILPGENNSLDNVQKKLNLPQKMQDGAVTLTWMTIPYGVIGEDGSIVGAEEENGTMVELSGTLTCSGLEAVYTVYANVFPPVLPGEEQLNYSIKKQAELADAASSHEKTLELPREIDGKRLTWSRPQEGFWGSLLVLTLLLAVCIYLQMDNEVHKKAEERKKQLMIDYPDLMWKMTMLLGAGLSIKAVFTRIANEYSTDRKKQGMRYVYEEVLYTCAEMESGIPESQSYERFGKRCQLPEYIRIGSVLSQNLKKGAKGLAALLEEEAQASLEERKNRARKIGEQAGTKLLLPMMLMLGVVLAILMVPAFFSF